MIVHDRLVGEDVLDLARRDAQRIFVGKARANHCMPQAEINALLVRLAREGKRVVRLKGGDPFVFGRGGEELAACRAAGIACEVVPGVTAALACAASTGIPLTHRDHARTVTFATGHTRDGRLDLDFAALARPGQTLADLHGRDDPRRAARRAGRGRPPRRNARRAGGARRHGGAARAARNARQRRRPRARMACRRARAAARRRGGGRGKEEARLAA